MVVKLVCTLLELYFCVMMVKSSNPHSFKLVLFWISCFAYERFNDLRAFQVFLRIVVGHFGQIDAKEVLSNYLVSPDKSCRLQSMAV